MVSTIDEITGLDGFWLLHYVIAARARALVCVCVQQQEQTTEFALLENAGANNLDARLAGSFAD